MKKYFVPSKIALDVKELGFNEPCFTYWVNDGQQVTFATDHNRSGLSMIGFTNDQMIKKHGLCTAPLYDQVIDWLREKHALMLSPCTIQYDGGPVLFTFEIVDLDATFEDKGDCSDDFKIYEDAKIDAIIKSIEIVKNKK